MNQEQTVCPICGSLNSRYCFSKNAYHLWQCADCQVGFIRPLPDADTLTAVYEQHVYHSGERYDIKNLPKSYRRLWQKRLAVIEKYSRSKGTLLDVGCATGLFLSVAQKNGWRVQGLEVSSNAVEQARAYFGANTIEQKDLLQYAPEKKYQVITAWALLEHVPDPLTYLRKIHTLLERGGIFALSTPNSSAYSFRRWGKEWRYFIPPEHLFYFDFPSLEYIFKRTGFDIVYKKTHFNFLAYLKPNSVLLRLYSQSRLMRIILKLVFYPVQLWSGLCYRGETLEVYARKIDS